MEYFEIDLTDPIFDEGDDEVCPMCGRAFSFERANITRDCGVISIEGKCKCGYMITFNYWIHDVIAEKE